MSEENKYGSGSSGHLIVDVKKKSGYFEVWREIGSFHSSPKRMMSIESLNIEVQDQVKKVLEGDIKSDAE